MTALASQKNRTVVVPTIGYDMAAPFYNSWHWSKFWQANEAPVLTPWLNALPDGPVLDAGCGTGRYRAQLQQRGRAYIGIDLSGNMLEAAAREANEAGESINAFHIADLRQSPLSPQSVNAVFCTRTLSHIENANDALKEFRRVLRSGGLALISDIHPDHPYTHTSIPTPEGSVRIETYKHNLEGLLDDIKTLGGLDVLRLHEYKVSDLLWKPTTKFDKLYLYPDKPVFYTLVLRKK